MPVSRKTLKADKRSEYNKQWYENQKKLGKCVSCARSAVHGTTRCFEHTNHNKEKYKAAVDGGLCSVPGCKNLPDGGKTKCQTHLRQGSEQAKVRTRELKQKVLNHYGQKCACLCGCGVTNIRWLTVDHRNNDGARHRKEGKVSTGRMFYAWIIRNRFPDNLQVLCWNCNCAKHFYGGCKE